MLTYFGSEVNGLVTSMTRFLSVITFLELGIGPVIQSNLYNKAKKRKESMTYHAKNLEEVKKIMDTQPGFIYAPWCGSEECELKMKDIKGLKSRCITEDNDKDTCVVCGKKSKHTVVWGIQY